MEISERIELAKKSVKGISIGDAFGESFFGETDKIMNHLQNKSIPESNWEFTDDTIMSIAILKELEIEGGINQNELINRFIKNHNIDPNRGYGATARRLLRQVELGKNWTEASRNVFDGMGSMGNGASMRVGPIGAFHFDDLDKVKDLAKKSAEITHSNLEGICGAIAVSIASAIATRIKLNNETFTPKEFLRLIIEELPDSDTKSKLNKSLSIPYSYNIETVKSILGNGIKMLSQDTVPFALWCASYNLNNFEDSIWKAVSILGDRDTICAIVGGITIMSSYENNIPIKWRKLVEKFELSEFYIN